MADWKMVKIGDVIQLEYGKPLPQEDRDANGLYPAYGANGELCRTNRFYHDKKTIIVGRKGSAGEVKLTEEKFWPLDVTYFVTFDDSQNDLYFIHYVLKFLNLPKLAKGVKPGINRNDIYSIQFPFPSLLEQKRIVEILDEAFEGIDAAIANTEKNLANTRELFENYFDQIFSLEEIKESQLGKIAGDVFTGPFGSLLHKSDYIKGGVPLVNPAHILDGVIVADENKSVSLEVAECLSGYRLKEGDVVIGRRGEIGRCAVVTQKEAGWICGTGCFFIRVFDNINSDFLACLLKSKSYQKKLEESASGATMLNLSNSTLSNFLIRMPDISVQNKIMQKSEELSCGVRELQRSFEVKTQLLNDLKQSLLQKAFRGELTSGADALAEVAA